MADFKCKEPGCGFESTGWDSKELAEVRGEQHKIEHNTGEPMPELHDFREEYGVSQ